METNTREEIKIQTPAETKVQLTTDQKIFARKLMGILQERYAGEPLMIKSTDLTPGINKDSGQKPLLLFREKGWEIHFVDGGDLSISNGKSPSGHTTS